MTSREATMIPVLTEGSPQLGKTHTEDNIFIPQRCDILKYDFWKGGTIGIIHDKGNASTGRQDPPDAVFLHQSERFP